MKASHIKSTVSRSKGSLPLEELLKNLGFLEPVERAVRKKLLDPALPSIADEAYSGEGFDYPLCRRMPLTRLAAVTWLLQKAQALYESQGVPEDIILSTFRDVSLRARLYHESTGKAGLRKEDVIWYRHIMGGHLFGIGELQFQPFEMVYLDEEALGEAYMTFDPAQRGALPRGTPVINCHIPRGANLSPAAITRSFQRAKAFFQERFPQTEFRAFLCYSWLLYPPMVRCLDQDSHIRGFAERFTIIGTCGDREQAMENLFVGGKRACEGNLTSLQRMAKEHPERFGFACGIQSVKPV